MTAADEPASVADAAGRAPTEEMIAIAARRNRIGMALTAVMVVAYFGFILLVAFAKPTAGHLLAGGRVSVGIVVGAGVILLAPVLTAIYVRWANRHYDVVVRRLRGGRA